MTLLFLHHHVQNAHSLVYLRYRVPQEVLGPQETSFEQISGPSVGYQSTQHNQAEEELPSAVLQKSRNQVPTQDLTPSKYYRLMLGIF